MFAEGCHLIDRAVALFGKPNKVTGFMRHDALIDDGLADNTLAVLEFDRAMAQINLAALEPHGEQYRFVEVLGTNGKAIAQPFTPLRLMVDLKEARGPYRAGPQTLEPAPPPGPPYAPDFLEMAHIIRDGARPSYSTGHDLIAHEAFLRALRGSIFDKRRNIWNRSQFLEGRPVDAADASRSRSWGSAAWATRKRYASSNSPMESRFTWAASRRCESCILTSAYQALDAELLRV